MMALSGVRSSWLINARNCDFALARGLGLRPGAPFAIELFRALLGALAIRDVAQGDDPRRLPIPVDFDDAELGGHG